MNAKDLRIIRIFEHQVIGKPLKIHGSLNDINLYVKADVTLLILFNRLLKY